jgi:hypothetical protein
MKRLIPAVVILIMIMLLTGCEMTNKTVIHTVTFYDGFGSSFVKEVEDGKTVSKPGTNPEAPAGTTKGLFKCWVVKSGNTETEYDFSQAVKSDLNLFATYYDGYTVSFYDSDGTLLSSEAAGTHNSYKITKPENPVSERDNEGSFKCWTLFDGTEWDFNSRVESNLNLYATYDKAYTVIFYNSEVIYTKEKVSEGEKAVRPETDPENIYKGSLKGWTTNPDRAEANDYDFTSPVTEDTVLYAYFNEAVYVTLTDSNDKVLGRIKVDYNTLCPQPDITSVDKSVIEKWQIEENGTWTDYDFSTPVTDSITLRAVCYAKADESKVLGAMKFAEVLSHCTGNETGDGTTDGFKNTDLIELFLAASNMVDSTTFDYYYDYGSERCYYYRPGSYIKTPEHVIYANLGSTSVKRYNYSSEDGKTEITAEGFNITVALSKGIVGDDGKVEMDTSSGSATAVGITLPITKLSLKIEKSGKVTLELRISNNIYSKTVMTSTVTDTSTGVDFYHTYSDSTSTEESALHEEFCTVTFNPGNGESVETREIVKGSKLTPGNTKPKDSYGADTFLFWAKGGVEFDFSQEITGNTVLEAVYTSHKDFMEKMLVAECIYRIPDIIAGYDNVFRDTTSVSEIFPNTTQADVALTKILLSSLFYADNSEKLYVPYEGKNYNYEDNTSFYTIYKLKDSIGKNESTKSGNAATIKLEDFSLTFQFRYNDGNGEKWYLDKLDNTFSIDSTIETDGDKTITTAVLKIGSRTYPELKATATTLPSGKEEVVYEYENLKFTRIY